MVTQLLVSPDDSWAALVTPWLTHLYDLTAMKYHGRLPVFEVRPLYLGIAGGLWLRNLGQTLPY